MSPDERDPQFLIGERLLEPVRDFTHRGGESDSAGRLGYRITERFIRRYFGRIFDNPDKVFDKAILQPETQDDAFADGVKYIVEAQQRSAQQYFDDGSIEFVCPPLQALLTIMAHGRCEGKTSAIPRSVSSSRKNRCWPARGIGSALSLSSSATSPSGNVIEITLTGISERRRNAEETVRETIYRAGKSLPRSSSAIRRSEYVDGLLGTLGAEPRL